MTRIGAQEIADRAVAVAGGAFGGIDGFVDVELAPGKARRARVGYSSNAPAPLASWIRPEQAIAPALTIGLKGWLSALSRIELKGSPEGSTPITLSTRAAPRLSSASANTNGFDIDWMVKGTRVSPTS